MHQETRKESGQAVVSRKQERESKQAGKQCGMERDAKSDGKKGRRLTDHSSGVDGGETREHRLDALTRPA